MKKMFALILAIMMVLSMMAGCAPSTSTSGLKTVEAGKLIMATNAEFPPYEYIEGGVITGIDVEIANAIAKKLGLELKI